MNQLADRPKALEPPEISRLYEGIEEMLAIADTLGVALVGIYLSHALDELRRLDLKNY